jgi:putative transposase
MARLARFFVKNQPQHIIQRGNNKDVIFAHEADYQFYLEYLAEAAEANLLKIHAYVLMTNHVHLLASPLHEQSIPKTLQSLGRRYVQYFNRSYGRTGTLWEGRYKATLIDSDQYLFTCMRYIELNPVRANMVRHPKNYPWSSYHRNANGKADALITPHDLYLSLGKDDKRRQAAYAALFKERLSQLELESIRDATNKAWVLGSEKFKNRVEKLSARRAKPKPRGRPKKKEDLKG